MRRLRTVIAAVLLAALVLAATGCGQIVESAAEKATGVSVDEDSDSVTVKGKDGEVTVGEGAELPDGFPEDVPVYEGDIISSLKTETGFSVGMETTDPSSDVIEWYKTELQDGDWTIKAEMTVEDGGNITAENDEWALNVVCTTDEDGKTTLILSIEKREK